MCYQILLPLQSCHINSQSTLRNSEIFGEHLKKVFISFNYFYRERTPYIYMQQIKCIFTKVVMGDVREMFLFFLRRNGQWKVILFLWDKPSTYVIAVILDTYRCPNLLCHIDVSTTTFAKNKILIRWLCKWSSTEDIKVRDLFTMTNHQSPDWIMYHTRFIIKCYSTFQVTDAEKIHPKIWYT